MFALFSVTKGIYDAVKILCLWLNMSFIKQIETGLSLDNLNLSNEIVVFFISNLSFFLLNVYFLSYDDKQIVY
jgi:hypothetical protein